MTELHTFQDERRSPDTANRRMRDQKRGRRTTERERERETDRQTDRQSQRVKQVGDMVRNGLWKR